MTTQRFTYSQDDVMQTSSDEPLYRPESFFGPIADALPAAATVITVGVLFAIAASGYWPW